MNDNFGDRMKDYESQETERKFMLGLPVYARIDGRGFSKFTKGMTRPFDSRMSQTMIDTTKELVDKTHATLGYVQSDEISLAWIPSINGTYWFDRKITKMTSVIAGLTTISFVQAMIENFGDESSSLLSRSPHFDARVISMPNLSEMSNMFLWRNQDCTKNAISMAAHHFYGHNELQGKSGSEKQEMLFAKGQNFNDYPTFFRRGTFVRRENVMRTLTEEELIKIPTKHRPDPNMLITRTIVEAFDLPPLNKVSNRVQVLFESAGVMLSYINNIDSLNRELLQ